MKKRITMTVVSILLLSGCNQKHEYPTIIVPNGTPTIAIANYAIDHEESIEVVAGAQPLTAAFGEAKKDIIIAPINLGALRYNSGVETYGYYRTIVWDNLYLVSREPVTDFYALEGKAITSFGKGSTPRIVFETILNTFGITADLTYVNDVVTANSLFSEHQTDYLISAEPNLTSLDKTEAYVVSLKDAWEEATGLSSYPQSAIFVKKERVEELKPALKEIDDAYDAILENVETSALNAHHFLTAFPQETLEVAIPKCGFNSFENEVQMVSEYFRLLLEVEMGDTIGGKLPNEDFYIQK